MKCFVCNKGVLTRQLADVEGKVKGKKYTVKTMAMVCDHCRHIALEGADVPEYMRKVADAYRRAHDRYTSDEIKTIRGRLSQQRFADALDVGVASVKRWELGLVQSKAHNKLIRAFQREEGAKWNYEFKEAPVESPSLSGVAGLWPLAHGPPSVERYVEIPKLVEVVTCNRNDNIPDPRRNPPRVDTSVQV
jgi:putative zinc finger/helix-turn-helix YgiT family protein